MNLEKKSLWRQWIYSFYLFVNIIIENKGLCQHTCNSVHHIINLLRDIIELLLLYSKTGQGKMCPQITVCIGKERFKRPVTKLKGQGSTFKTLWFETLLVMQYTLASCQLTVIVIYWAVLFNVKNKLLRLYSYMYFCPF